jgi:hypothetical protein
LQANFFDIKNSINRQINGNLEPPKGFGINFFGVISPSDIFIHILDNDQTRGRPLETPKKPCLDSWQGSAKLSPPLPSPPPSEFCTDEDNSVNRSAMDALRYSKK